MYRQYQLRSDDNRLTCWLEDDRLNLGILITLKHDPVKGRWWEIVGISEMMLAEPPEKRWRVGGLT